MAKNKNGMKKAIIKAVLAVMKKYGILKRKFLSVSAEDISKATEVAEAVDLMFNEAHRNFKLDYIDIHSVDEPLRVSSVVDQGSKTAVIVTDGCDRWSLMFPTRIYRKIQDKAYKSNFADAKTMFSQMTSHRLAIKCWDEPPALECIQTALGEIILCFKAEISDPTMKKFTQAFVSCAQDRTA